MTMTAEDRLSRLEGAYEQVGERLNNLHDDMVRIHERIDRLETNLRVETREQFDAHRQDVLERLSENRQDVLERLSENRQDVAERLEANRQEMVELRREHRQDRRNMLLVMVGVWSTVVAGIIAVLLRIPG